MNDNDGPLYHDHFYRSADDRLNLYARIYDIGAKTTPILLMHGLTRNSADFENLAAILSPHHNLIIPDQRGRGKSDYDNDPSQYRPDIYAADMFALLASLNVKETVMIGTSMGGLIAMLMAAHHQPICRALILNDIGPEVESKGLRRLQQYVGKSPKMNNWQDAANLCRASNEIAFPDYDEKDWMKFARRTCEMGQDGALKFAYDLSIANGVQGDKPNAAPANLWPLWEILNGIPILCIRGETSDILTPQILHKMHHSHAPNFSYIEIMGRGHAPMLDEPDAVRAIEQFLQINR
ncbi:hypothetical protein LPB140_10665 [Sphingorhabdus lutea]|uniref:AB hydrolase-1 domain-containing protein n=2 Tax=Sphingorhabdus lutea TaxID=1913578 RepID=A0A1L3JDH2_9SPHN|nr:hypothetical protein LPB140_10665 [Sphingorhabdus lutea]